MLTLRQLACLSALAVVGMLTLGTPLLDAQTLSPDELASVLDNAATKENHLKLAGHFEAEAKQLREDATRHEAMTARYKKMPARPGALHEHMARHCENLVASLRSAAKESDELAAAHRKMAESPK
ncbi:MAG: hypothetical protein GC160_15550 [Acidobacteria bacterium]|nr:hypothetical protein [Acidobacteriota bacterium]